MWMSFLWSCFAVHVKFGSVEAGEAVLLEFSILKVGAGQCCWKHLHAVLQESTVWQERRIPSRGSCVPASGLFWCPVAELQLQGGGERLWVVSWRHQGWFEQNKFHKLRS